MRNGRRTAAPYMTVARFASTCPETGKPIQKGDEIAYYPATRTAYHAESNSAGSVRGAAFASACDMADADW